MEEKRFILRWRGFVSLLALSILSASDLSAQTGTAPTLVTNYTILIVKGDVGITRAGARPDFLERAEPGKPLLAGDRVRIGPKSQLTIQRADQSTYRFDEKTEFLVLEPKTAAQKSTTMRLIAGVLYFFHRGKPDPFDVETRTASAAIRGTEFNLQIDDAGTTVITVIDGTVDLSNDVNTVPVLSGQQGVAQPGQAPFVRPQIEAINNIIQWTFYYPGVLDPDEILLTDQERAALASSLAAYRAGDLLRALGEYPAGRQAQSDAERVYLAGLLLSVGQVDDALPLLAPISGGGQATTNARLAGALQQVIGSVKSLPIESNNSPELATEWLAESYRLQSLANLEGALEAALRSVQKSPEFGFGWARVAELEFSFGRIDAATEAIAKALQHSPRNAQAVALNGFLFAARNKIDSAIQQFNQAIEIDGGLANAWLGRGLCLIRKGRQDTGREDLLTAAALEPQRAFLRSYLGKAWTDAGEKQLAERELELAKQFDQRDPTAWLYSSLLKQRHNRINEAIGDLEHAQDLSTNRSIYRSRFHLDQDLAVRSANLARVYKDAGMFEVSIREAGRAVTADYTSYSAHLFLAESYTQLRDPQLRNFRYETAATAEYSIANLLAPVGAGILSPTISEGEYSKLFERNGFGLVSATEYLSRGAWEQSAAQFGTFGNFSYSLEGEYRTDPGERPNNDFESEGLSVQLKQQLSEADMVYFSATRREREGGDPFQRYDPNAGNTGVRFNEKQEPLLVFGYHRTWSPESHTLFSAMRTDHNLSVSDQTASSLFVRRPEGPILSVHNLFFQREFENRLVINSVEGQQILTHGNHQIIGGVRYQKGDIDSHSRLANPTDFHLYFPDPGTTVLEQMSTYDFERLTTYAYDTWRLHESLSITAGLAYDHVSYPENVAGAPITDDTSDKSQLSPKAGLVWTPRANTVVRAAYAQTIVGVGADQSLQIEPTQVAGFNQTHRTLAPPAFYGTTPGERFEMFGISLEQKLFDKTYLGLEAGRLTSTGSRVLGSFETPPPEDLFALPSGIRENIDFEENSLTATLNHLIGNEWAFGLSYRLADAQLDRAFPDAPAPEFDPFSGPALEPGARIETVLHKISAYSLFNHRSGVFAGVDASWYKQDIDGVDGLLENDSFWQFNVVAGYRFWKRKAEVTLGLLNLTDQDYRLLPLNFYLDLPRERTFLVRLRWNL